ncbi:oxidoreductase [Parendozoicomonas sp. Alg238-R29]|uniref:oxidoreductase n=1 Tax=Parendozoicomonas sp. Alg238-R29 TaxID=2993446 RepID=UPI00248EFB31|nr:oxidoreductase [Parendozoicomonas sp. Alg238-R29]
MTHSVCQNSWTSDSIQDLSGKVVIVTGSSSGIGLETARVIAEKNAEVIVAVRNPEKGAAAVKRIKDENPGAKVKLLLLDLADLSSVRMFAEEFKSLYQRLDILINNAGVMTPPYSKTADGFELQMGTNHLGHFALSGLLMDLLIKTENSRLIVVSSIAHNFGNIDFDDLAWEIRSYNPMNSYGDSKLANLYFMSELVRRLKDRPGAPLVAGAHPGWTETELQRTNASRHFNKMFAMKPWKGALPTLRAACDADVHNDDFYGPKGLTQLNGFPVKVKRNKRAQDHSIAANMWDVSEKLTEVKFFG